MDTGGIIPDIIDVKPKLKAEVSFPCGVKAQMGNELTPTQVKDQPTVTWTAEDNALYTLFMVDPDAPSRAEPTAREVLHWLVINIPGNKVAQGKTVAEYVGSGAPEGTGLHRYAVLAFKQPGKIDITTFIPKTQREGRIGVKTRDYITKYNLGAPVAGNYFEAQYDDYVPIITKQVT